MNDKDDLLKVKTFSENQYDNIEITIYIAPKKLPNTPKSPDYEIRDKISKSLVAYAELKTFNPIAYEKHLQRSYNGKPGFEDKISNLISDASEQLYSANPNHLYPNILIILNKNQDASLTDLMGSFTGKHFYSDEQCNSIALSEYMNISEGKIAGTLDGTNIRKKDIFDMFIWIDCFPNKPLDLRGTYNADSSYKKKLVQIFGKPTARYDEQGKTLFSK